MEYTIDINSKYNISSNSTTLVVVSLVVRRHIQQYNSSSTEVQQYPASKVIPPNSGHSGATSYTKCRVGILSQNWQQSNQPSIAQRAGAYGRIVPHTVVVHSSTDLYTTTVVVYYVVVCRKLPSVSCVKHFHRRRSILFLQQTQRPSLMIRSIPSKSFVGEVDLLQVQQDSIK